MLLICSALPETEHPGRIIAVGISQIVGVVEVGIVVIGVEVERIAGLLIILPDSIINH